MSPVIPMKQNSYETVDQKGIFKVLWRKIKALSGGLMSAKCKKAVRQTNNNMLINGEGRVKV